MSAGVKFPAGQLERLEDRQHLLDAGYGQERLDLQFALVADDADDGAHLAAAEVRLEPQFTNALQNVFNVFFGGVGTENDNHGGARRQGKYPGRHGLF